MPVTITFTVDDPPAPHQGFRFDRFEVGLRGQYKMFPATGSLLATALWLAAERWSDYGMASSHLYAVYVPVVGPGEFLREWTGMGWPHRRARS